MVTVINASAAVTLLEQRPEKNLGSGRDSGEHCTGIVEVVGSNPVQSLNFFQVSVLVGRTCINDRYHSVATMGQITFKN